ncbi:hypothetical protein GP486_006275 [Trichoglossum hirsutum]|uniref:Uncharacterized protein n=1 Tax=Trichoglossum hirsutum TaxID=265104 RepID=A0A9P8IH56_9PEZI|nr:hypothetical protein GP486_006275 [Trichoglossum hirsutum]
MCIDPRLIEFRPPWTSLDRSVQGGGGGFGSQIEGSPNHHILPETTNSNQTLVEVPMPQLSSHNVSQHPVPGEDHPSDGINNQEALIGISGRCPAIVRPMKAAGPLAPRVPSDRRIIPPQPTRVTKTTTQTSHAGSARGGVARRPQDEAKKAKTQRCGDGEGPCPRFDLIECGVFRDRSPIWGNKSPAPDAIRWHPLDRERRIQYYHVWPADHLTTTGPKFEVLVKKFVPQEDELTSRNYTTAGGFAQADRPHFATVEPIEKLSSRQLKWGSMVDLALTIFVGSRLASSERSMLNLDEARPIHDETSIWNRVNMIPPLLDYQLDKAVIMFQTKLLDEIYKRIYRKAKSTKTEDGSWFEMFLTFFILMQNVQFVHQIQRGFPDYILASHYDRHREIIADSARMVEGWEHSAPNIANVFLYFCDRHFKTSPFSGGAIEKAAELAGLKLHEIQFLCDRSAIETKMAAIHVVLRNPLLRFD